MQPASAINTEENRLAGALEYDDLAQFASVPPQTDSEVTGLRKLAGQGPVLELGVGTGRVAIPLADSGLDVHGIELDPAMVEQLRRKPGGERVQVHTGDMADVDVNSIHIRYSWPSELDLMARLAGLRLHDRWSTWDRDPFGPGDHHHISVYGR